jgi:sugar-specific transcriptional regulator TrmB
METDEKILIEAGLSEEQALVYGHLLDRGPQKASALSKWLGIKRGLVYKVLEQLETMNLVEKKGGVGTVASFSPLHPSHLLEMIESRAKSILLTKETLTYSLGSLASKFNLLTGKPNVQFYEGKEGVQKVLDDTLNTDGEVLTYLDIEIVEKYFKDINDSYVTKREKKGIKKRILVIDNEYSNDLFKKRHVSDPEFFSVTDLRMVKTPLQGIEGAIQIYNNKIGIITISKDNLISIIIEDARIHQLFKSMFEALYLVSPKFTP